MANKDRYEQGTGGKGTEYGGKSGLIQSSDDGHVMDAQDKATVMRMHGMQGDLTGTDADFEVNEGTDVDGTKWQDVAHRNKALRRRNLDIKVNGRTIEEAL